MSATWMQTTRRLLPRLARLAREIRPTFHLTSAADIDRTFLVEHDVETLLWDVDGTLMGHHARALAPEIAPAVEDLFGDPGLLHAIVSNCQEPRFEELGRIFPRIPVVLGYETAEGPAFRIRRGPHETWAGPGAEIATSGATAGATLPPLRKPSGELVKAALETLGVETRPEAALMVGDQYFTDIASANLAGIRSAKVPAIDPPSFPAPVRISHRLERWLYRLLYGRPGARP
jgi:predicted HAD superfamily phosphohydrolase YqeG